MWEQTYRECVCAIVLPHLQQGHHHFMEFISRQDSIAVHIKHFEANWQWNERDIKHMYEINCFLLPRNPAACLLCNQEIQHFPISDGTRVISSTSDDPDIQSTFCKPFSHFHKSHKAETDRDCNDKTSPDLFFCHDCKAQHGLHFCLSATGPLQQADSPQEISLKSMWLSRFSSKAWNKPAKK